jgi:CubicO group peptidase (beta-lactamase class C family)
LTAISKTSSALLVSLAAAACSSAPTVSRSQTPLRPARACFSNAFHSRVQQGLAGYADVVDIPGVSVGVVTADSLLFTQSTGYANRAARRPTTSDTPFVIASVTKVFTAMLALVLADEGLLDLDKPISDYLPGSVTVPVDSLGNSITVRHLITHTSALPIDPPNRKNLDPGGPADPLLRDAYNVRDLYQALPQTKLVGTVGDKFRYSNYGYALLGHVLERVAGQKFEPLIKARILTPLGMSATSITLSPEQERNLAAFYWSEVPTRVEQSVRSRFGEVAAFIGLTSTVRDLSKFAEMHLRAARGDTTTMARIARRMTEAQTQLPDDPFIRTEMGLGWFRLTRLDVKPPQLFLFHMGEVDGQTSGIFLEPAAGIGVVVLQNLGGEEGSRGIDAFGFWLLQAVSEERTQCHF